MTKEKVLTLLASDSEEDFNLGKVLSKKYKIRIEDSDTSWLGRNNRDHMYYISGGELERWNVANLIKSWEDRYDTKKPKR